MATIRRKTIENKATEYLSYARTAGVDLSWNNYERMLPQDGFARLGLSCSDCLMGPCRINPFDRNAATSEEIFFDEVVCKFCFTCIYNNLTVFCLTVGNCSGESLDSSFVATPS